MRKDHSIERLQLLKVLFRYSNQTDAEQTLLTR